MEKILQLLKPLLLINWKHPFLILGVSILLALFAGNFALKLSIDTDIANLLPDNNEHVKALERLEESIGGETPMQVAIESPSFEANRQFARELIDESMKLYDPRTENKFFERVGFKRDTEVLKDNALYFATNRELENIIEYLEEEIQSAKESANPFFIDFEEEEEDSTTGDKLSNFEDSYDTLVPDEYPVNQDSTIMVIEFFPTGSKSDLTYLRDMFAAYDSLLSTMNPQSYHEEMKVLFGGRLKRHLSELDSIMNDVYNSFASGISSVIILVMLYFFIKKYRNYRKGHRELQHHTFWEHLVRIPVPVMVIGIPLLISLTWTFGISYLVLGTLNTMTSVLFVILFGMGIDYGIHYYARYIEFRSDGHKIRESLLKTYRNTGSAILVSALTTAFSLYVLILAKFRGFSEFGFIAGTGIILALFCMLFILPSLLVIFENMGWILLNENKEVDNRKKDLFHRFPFSRTIVIIGIVISGVVIWNSNHIRFQYDFSKLEPEFPEYENFRAVAGEVYSGEKRNPAYILADTDREVVKILEKLRHKMETDTTSPTILDVEALQERFPPNDSIAINKLEKIAQIRDLLQDPFIESREDEQLDKLRRASQTREPLEMDDIPEYLKSKFVNKDGELGNFVIVYPSVGLSDGRKSIAFKHDVGKVTLDNGKEFYAASTSIIAAEMLELMRKESPWMVGATFMVVFLLMLFSFRSLRWAIIAMLPLMVGLLFLFGIMLIFGLMFNFYNLVVLPAILGIGEDNGVHLAHRYREEGKNSMWQVLSSTGQHVTIGSLTTMLGFSGLLFTNHPGLQSLGMMAVIGIGMTLFTAVTFLPALIQWLEDNDWIRY